MADVTPRFMWQNFAHLTNTVLTVSSEDASFPRRWMTDPMKTMAWRSKIGWNIVAGFNDKLDFNLAGVKVATITAGNYATGAAMATAVQTALAAAYATGVWTVSYSSSTFKFTITHSITAFTILPVTGANTTSTITTDLGYAADTVSATSQVSSAEVYQSRSFIKFDLGSALSTDVVCLAGMGTLTSSGRVRIQGNATDAWTAPSYSGVETPSAQIEGTVAHWTGVRSYRWWRIVIDDPFRSNGYVACGVPYIGSYLQLRGPKSQAVIERQQRLSNVSVGDGGGIFVDYRSPAVGRELTFEHLSTAAKDNLLLMQKSFDMKPQFFAVDPQNNPTKVDYGGVLVGEFEHMGDNVSGALWGVTLTTQQQVQ